MNRRHALCCLAAGGVLGAGPRLKAAGLPALKITDVKTVLTQPGGGDHLVVVKVMTSEPGLYGVAAPPIGNALWQSLLPSKIT
jgi:hypothetical protein